MSGGEGDRKTPFPPDFKWGTATAAFQIEGAHDADGKGESIWDRFSHEKGNVQNGDNGDVACDHYNKFKDDVKLMQSLGIKHYRFSIAWTRLFPTGAVGEALNEPGAAFYDDLIDALIEHGIEPLATIYHWDHPAALLDEFGGFLSPEIIERYLYYARACFERYGDRVKSWITFNEPFCVCAHGFCTGMHAPGKLDNPGRDPYTAAHHLLLAHAKAYRMYEKEFKAEQGGCVGITLNTEWFEPRNPKSEKDIEASMRYQSFHLGWFADPVYKGDYPAEMRERLGDRLPTFSDDEKEILRGSSDFFGLNHYTTFLCGKASTWLQIKQIPGDLSLLFKSAGSTRRGFAFLRKLLFAKAHCLRDPGATLSAARSWKTTDMGWSIVPWGLEKLLVYIQERYKPPGGIIITENGCAMSEKTKEAAMSDPGGKRTNFMREYISAVGEAIRKGADVRGYFLWSFLDNFEWAFGYGKRFGMVYVDYDTQERAPKPAAEFYSRVAKTNGLALME